MRESGPHLSYGKPGAYANATSRGWAPVPVAGARQLVEEDDGGSTLRIAYEEPYTPRDLGERHVVKRAPTLDETIARERADHLGHRV